MPGIWKLSHKKTFTNIILKSKLIGTRIYIQHVVEIFRLISRYKYINKKMVFRATNEYQSARYIHESIIPDNIELYQQSYICSETFILCCFQVSIYNAAD